MQKREYSIYRIKQRLGKRQSLIVNEFCGGAFAVTFLYLDIACGAVKQSVFVKFIIQRLWFTVRPRQCILLGFRGWLFWPLCGSDTHKRMETLLIYDVLDKETHLLFCVFKIKKKSICSRFCLLFSNELSSSFSLKTLIYTLVFASFER